MSNLLRTVVTRVAAEESKVEQQTFSDGEYAVLRFSNGFGVSLIDYAGGIEIALIQFFGERLEDYRLAYNETFTSRLPWSNDLITLLTLARDVRDLL